MTSDDLRDGLPAHLDGELPPGESRVIESALKADPALRQEADELRAVDGLLAHHPVISPSAGFVEGALARASAAPRARPLGLGIRRAISMTAAASVLVAAGYLLARMAGPGAEERAGIPLRDFGVLAKIPETTAPVTDLDSAVREIEAIEDLFLELG